MHSGQNPGYGKRMIDIGLAGKACLALMYSGTEQVGMIYILDVLRFQVSFQQRTQVTDQESRRIICNQFFASGFCNTSHRCNKDLSEGHLQGYFTLAAWC